MIFVEGLAAGEGVTFKSTNFVRYCTHKTTRLFYCMYASLLKLKLDT